MDEKKIQKSVLEKSCADHEVGNYEVDEFPTGLKILIVDDDRTCLLVLERMLRKLLYEVTKCQVASDALALLGEDKSRFDIVICDLHMPDMDGFKLLQIIGLEMDLPVVMMSSDDAKGVVMKSIIHGACDYLVKPVRIEAIRLIWQHVVRKRKRSFRYSQPPVNDNLLLSEQANDTDGVAAADGVAARDKVNPQSLKRTREDEDIDGESSDEVTTAKKPRIVWTQELHDMFVVAVNQLGRDKAVPKKILERMQAMNVTGITRANIASHLQKYRMHLQKARGIVSTDNRDPGAFFKQVSSFGQPNLQYQSTRTSCELPLQNLITSQSCRFKTANENSSTGPRDHQGSNVFDSIFSESSRSCLPTEFSLHDLSGENLLYQNDFPRAIAVSNEEYLYRNVGNVTDLSNPLYAVDELICEPSVLVRQYQDDIFHGPFV